MIHGGDALGDARRMIHRRRDVGDRRSDVDPFRTRRDPGKVHLGSGLMGVVLEEVVLRRPVVLEPDRVAQLGDFQLAQISRVLVVPRGAVHLREDPELHGASFVFLEP
jgi:hypothetical protein